MSEPCDRREAGTFCDALRTACPDAEHDTPSPPNVIEEIIRPTGLFPHKAANFGGGPMDPDTSRMLVTRL